MAGRGGIHTFHLTRPGNVLSGLMKRSDKDVEMLSVSDVPTLEAVVGKLKG